MAFGCIRKKCYEYPLLFTFPLGMLLLCTIDVVEMFLVPWQRFNSFQFAISNDKCASSMTMVMQLLIDILQL